MPRARRKVNRSLPVRWTYRHGAYYFRIPPGMSHLWGGKKSYFPLGKTLPEALRKWADMVEKPQSAEQVSNLLDRFLLEVVPTKKPKTQASYNLAVQQLRKVFGEMRLADIKPQMIYQYVDKRSKKQINPTTNKSVGGRTVALREIEVLSIAYTKAVEWGYIDRHPFKGEVRFEAPKPRTRLVEDWEIVECLKLDSKRKKGSVRAIQAYIRLKLITGMSRYDLLSLTEDSLKADGIHIMRHKTAGSSGKRTNYEWTSDLKAAIARVKDARPAVSTYLFCNMHGEGYINKETDEAPGWKTMWQNFMKRVLSETKVAEHFTEHDLRAKCASNAKTLDHARALLSHVDSGTTLRVYRRAPERVQPLPDTFNGTDANEWDK